MAALIAASPSGTFFCWNRTVPARKFRRRRSCRPHGAPADADAGLVQQAGRLVRLSQHDAVFRGQQQQRNLQLPKMIGLRPGDGRGQGRIHAPVIGHQVRHLAVAEAFFQQAGVGTPHGIVGGGVARPRGSSLRDLVLAADHRQSSQLEQGDAGQGVVELAAGDHGPLQGHDGLALVSRGGQGRAQFHAHPRLRPVVGRPDAALQRGLQILEQLIARCQRSQQLRPPPDGQRRAAHDLLHVDRAAAKAS